MNKKIIVIMVVTICALVILYMYSFGPLAGNRTSNTPNPESLHPTNTEKVLFGKKDHEFSTYHNKDVKENFYAVKLPKDWEIKAGKDPGGYSINFSNGYGIVELLDIPDNTTVELYVLSQEEPKLKQSAKGYKRIDYKKMSINKNDSYQFLYVSAPDGDTTEAVRTYISGADNAGVITLSIKQKEYPNVQELFDTIINSFTWENK